jgi:hypothetical protein
MPPNPLLRKLGYSDDDRLAIIHVDDVGMCHASLQAFADLWEFGTISSGAVMVPCPWFPATAAWARAHPEVDLGVHGTVNAEWAGYRWGPVSTGDPATGLMDDEGYFHRAETGCWELADAGAVRLEIDAQVERALAAGLDVTHIDTHMGTLTHPKFIPGYLQTLHRFAQPGLIPRMDKAGLMGLGLPIEEDAAEMFVGLINGLEAAGYPLIDAIDYLPLDDPAGQIDLAKRKLAAMPPGITHFLMHPAIDTPELRAITPDWPSRVANYEAFMSHEVKQFIRDAGIQVIGYRPLRDLVPGRKTPEASA